MRGAAASDSPRRLRDTHPVGRCSLLKRGALAWGAGPARCSGLRWGPRPPDEYLSGGCGARRAKLGCAGLPPRTVLAASETLIRSVAVDAWGAGRSIGARDPLDARWGLRWGPRPPDEYLSGGCGARRAKLGYAGLPPRTVLAASETLI